MTMLKALGLLHIEGVETKYIESFDHFGKACAKANDLLRAEATSTHDQPLDSH